MGFLPTWEEDGLVMCQSNAILRMLGMRLGYYTDEFEEDENEAAQQAFDIDSLCDFMEDIILVQSKYILPAFSGDEVDEDPREYLKDFWDKQIIVVNNRLVNHGQPFVGGTQNPTIADFKLFA